MHSLIKLIGTAALCYSLIGCNNNGKPPAASSQAPAAVPSDKPNGVTSARSGDEIFKAKCIFCHGLQGNTANMGAQNLQVSLVDSLTIVQVIKNGRGKMPPFDDQFPDSEMSSLVAYVRSLRKENQ